MDPHEREAAGAAEGMRDTYGGCGTIRDAYGREIARGVDVVYRLAWWEPGRTERGQVVEVFPATSDGPGVPHVAVRLADESVQIVAVTDLMPF